MSTWHSSREYRVWRVKVIRKQKECLICSSRKRRAAHHMNSGSYFPNERYDLNNGVCLCGEHHSMFHNSYKNSYREKCTKKDFANFLELMIKISDETGCYNKKKMIEFRLKILK